jgi:cytochrome c nitrite reductase small subunit
MAPRLASLKSSDHKAAACEDCHEPHNGYLRGFLFKASDGLRHLAMSILHAEPRVIRIHAAGADTVQENCIRCHTQVSPQTDFRAENPLLPSPKSPQPIPKTAAHADATRACVECHRETPHGRVATPALNAATGFKN